MKNIIIFIQLGMLLCMSSCNFLNVEDEFNDMFSYDSVFANKRNVERYLWATAANFPDEGFNILTLLARWPVMRPLLHLAVINF